MKNLKALTLMALAILAGLGAAIFAASWVAERGNIASTKSSSPPWTSNWEQDQSPDAHQRRLADGISPAGRLHRPEAAPGPRGAHQRRTRRSLLERKLMPVGAQGGLSAVIAEGKRAMTVRVNDVVGVAGFAFPATTST